MRTAAQRTVRKLANSAYLGSRSYLRTRKLAKLTLSPTAASLALLPEPDHVLVGVQSRLIILRIPKAANSFLSRWLDLLELEKAGLPARDLTDFELWNGGGHRMSPTALLDLPGGYLEALNQPPFRTLCVVRDPLERLVSCYLDKSRSPRTSAIRRKLPARSWGSIERFLTTIMHPRFTYSDPHWAPQSWLVGEGSVRLDDVIPIEDLNRCLLEVGQHLGARVMPVRDPDYKVTNAKKTSEEVVDKSLRFRVYDAFEADLSLHRNARLALQ